MANRSMSACIFQRSISRPWRKSNVGNISVILTKREQSDYAIPVRDEVSKSNAPPSKLPNHAPNSTIASGLERLPTPSLLRNYFMGLMFTRPMLFNASFSILQRIANSRWTIMNPDRNPVLRAVVKPMIYDQFCAGTNQREIFRTRDIIKHTGYSGIILCYGKEIEPETSGRPEARVDELKQWLDGNLETLDMMGEGDWLGIKLTGTGKQTTTALRQNLPAPPDFVTAMDQICAKAREKNCRIWIDAEQQEFQASIDLWTIDMMRKHNRTGEHGQALVYNTLQAYLKASRPKLRHQLSLAREEGWTLAIKLVRGAYIATDLRERIHDTKQDTDDSYNGIVKDLLSGTGADLGLSSPEDFPRVRLFLAGHNPTSVDRAWGLVQSLAAEGKLRVVPDFGQLQGMADELGCKVLAKCEAVEAEGKAEKVVPKIYKCLTWGTIQECMQYLIRRIVENKGGADRMRDGMGAYRAEIRRRMFGARA